MLANGDDIANAFVTTYQGTAKDQRTNIAHSSVNTNVTPEMGQSSFLTCKSMGGVT